MTVLSVVGAALSLLTAILGLIAGWRVSRRGRYHMWPDELVVKLPSGDALVPSKTNVEHLRRRSRPANMNEQEWHLLLVAVAARDRRKSDVPDWVLRLLRDDDADRYRKEWAAHLHQLIEEGELRHARRDRRRLVLAAVTLAVALRVRRALGPAR